MDFHFVKVGQRPLLAVPCVGWVLRLACVSCYPAHTWRKRVLRELLWLAFFSGFARWIWPAGKVPIPRVGEDEFAAWLESLRLHLDQADLQPVVIWPSDPARGRLYLYFLDAGGNKLAFCKLALDDCNSAFVRHETGVLHRLRAKGLTRCRVPKVLASGLLGHRSYLLVEASPSGARVSEWCRDASLAEIIAEYAGSVRRLTAEQLATAPWWPPLRAIYGETSPFYAAILEASRSGADVCLVHGDLNQTNVLRQGPEVWLLDWEQSQENGPCMTDLVCIAVDYFWLSHPSDPAGNLRKLKEDFFVLLDDESRNRVILGLAYLGAAGFTPALAMIREWFPATRSPGHPAARPLVGG
jgi:hypothetical protein